VSAWNGHGSVPNELALNPKALWCCAETVGIGVDEAQFQKTQILQRLKLIQKVLSMSFASCYLSPCLMIDLIIDPSRQCIQMRDQTSAFLHATTLSQPTLVSDPDAGYFNHDRFVRLFAAFVLRDYSCYLLIVTSFGVLSNRKEEQWERLSVSKQSSSSAMYSGPFASVVSRPPLARPPSDPVRSAAAQASTSAGGIAISGEFS